MAKVQQEIAGAKTASPPAATSYNSQYMLAWTDTTENADIWWASWKYDADFNLVFTETNTNTDFSPQFGFGPALTNFNGTPWMAFLENPAQAPFIPPSVERRQPPIIMVSSYNGTKWSSPQPLWDPGLTGSDLFVEGYQGPAAISSPAIAANTDEILAVWVENASADGSDAIVIWYEDEPAPKPQIFFSKYTPAGGWVKRAFVKDALTQENPALVAVNDVFYMAWKGQFDSSIYFAQYTDAKGWGHTAKLPDFETSSGPSLGADAAGNVQMVWKGKSGDNLYLATLKAGTSWSTSDPGNGRSAQRELPVIATSLQPALSSQFSSPDLLLTYKGASENDIFAVPLSAFALVTTPAGGLGSNSNYIFAPYQVAVLHECNQAIPNLSVTMEVTEDIVLISNSAAASGSQLQGFSFQLNCYASSSQKSAWQQYLVALWGTELTWWIDNWPLSGNNIYNDYANLAPVPNSNTLPKGYKLEMSLIVDSVFRVTGAVYKAWDNHGALIGNSSQSIALPATELSPIIAFELNLVGPGNSENAVLKSGKGNITYTSTHGLYTLSGEPSCAESGYVTAETANTTYEKLANYPSGTIQQSFDVSGPGAPMISREGKIRPHSIIRL